MFLIGYSYLCTSVIWDTEYLLTTNAGAPGGMDANELAGMTLPAG